MLIPKNRLQKSLSLVSVLGTVLSVMGLFLPWGTLTWPSGVFGVGLNQVSGFDFLIGDFALAACLLSILFLILDFRKPKSYVKLVFAGETVVAFFSLLWILESRYLPWSWNLTYFSPAYYAPMYGAYVSLIGSLIALSAIAIELMASEKPAT